MPVQNLLMAVDLPRSFWDALGIDSSRCIEKLVVTVERNCAVAVEIKETLTLPKQSKG